jgi:hypothetical protein
MFDKVRSYMGVMGITWVFGCMGIMGILVIYICDGLISFLELIKMVEVCI